MCVLSQFKNLKFALAYGPQNVPCLLSKPPQTLTVASQRPVWGFEVCEEGLLRLQRARHLRAQL